MWNCCSTSLQMTLYSICCLNILNQFFCRWFFDATTPRGWHIYWVTRKEEGVLWDPPARLHRCFLSSSIFGAKRPISQAKWFLFKNIDQLPTWGFTFGLFVLTQLSSFFFFNLYVVNSRDPANNLWNWTDTFARSQDTSAAAEEPWRMKVRLDRNCLRAFLFFWVVLH